jgi:fused signal recognition particle receptor
VILAIALIALVVIAAGTMLVVRTSTLRRSRRGTELDGATDTAPEIPPASPTVAVAPESSVAIESPPPSPSSDEVPAELVVAAPPRLGDRLGRARQALAASFAAVRGRGRVDAELFDELEEALILADVGLATTNSLLDPLRATFRGSAGDPDAVLSSLKASILELFDGDDAALALGPELSVWLFVGVNGVGKTTTIGKLAYRETTAGRTVVLAAGDTFRAAAGEQLDVWAKRTNAEIVQGADGADPSSVIFDGIAHADAVGADLVLADTAGRLHTKTNLMEELRKVRRVADRPPGHVTEVLLVIDATTGQNGLTQAREFKDAVGVTGIVLTKLDGSAKGGIVLAIRAELGLPIKLVGLGEGVADLVAFEPGEFVDALFS